MLQPDKNMIQEVAGYCHLETEPLTLYCFSKLDDYTASHVAKVSQLK